MVKKHIILCLVSLLFIFGVIIYTISGTSLVDIIFDSSKYAPDEQAGTYWEAEDGKSWFEVCPEHGYCFGEFYINGKSLKASYEFDTHHENTGTITVYSNEDLKLDCTSVFVEYIDEPQEYYYGECTFSKEKFSIKFFEEKENELVFKKKQGNNVTSCITK
jgi:hypothetical protein